MPTCTEAGHHDEVVYCELCGKEISRKENVVDPAFGHAATYQNIIELAKEDCENKGLYQIDYVCSACNEVIDKKIFEKPALGHTVVSYISSLEKDGELNYYLENFCNRCGKEWKVSKIDFSKMDIPEDVRVRALELLCKIKSAPTFFKTISLVEKYNGDYKAYVKDQLDDVSLYTLFETAYELQQTEGIKDNGINDAMRNMEIQSDLAKKIEIEKSAYEKEPKRDNGEYVKDLTDLLPKDDKRIGDFADKILPDKNVKNENDIKKSVEDTFKKETILGMNEEMFDKEEMKKKLEAKTYNVIQSFSSKPSKDISIVEDGSKISLTWINIPTESEDIFKLEAKDEFASLKLRLNSNESNVTLVK